MLEKVDKSPDVSGDGVRLLQVSSIHPDSTFECYAYVRGGRHKFTKADKPFITLYLQDKDGVVIPGYVFDVQNFKNAGLELTKVIHSIVKVTVAENYLPKLGMSVIINKCAIVTSPPPAMWTTFVGQVGNIDTVFQGIKTKLAEHLGLRINFPYTMCKSSYLDYYQGKVGGQCLHYSNMLKTLEVWSEGMTEAEARQLYVTFVLYVFVHNSYIAAVEAGEDDIQLIGALPESVSKHMEALEAGAGASEVIHLFFGYEPKDVFVRMVHEASKANMRVMEELSVYRSLPISREGDAGYGTIKRYPEEGAKS